MRGLSRRNIAYDLNISPYESVVLYPENTQTVKVIYVFSSELYKRNFESKLQEHREKINQSLSNRFGFNIRYDKLSDLKLYTTIEKRGFLIYQDGDKFECLDNIVLDGVNLIMQS